MFKSPFSFKGKRKPPPLCKFYSSKDHMQFTQLYLLKFHFFRIIYLFIHPRIIIKRIYILNLYIYTFINYRVTVSLKKIEK